MQKTHHALTCGRTITPHALRAKSSVEDVLNAMTAYNGARLAEACRLFREKIAQPNVIIGWTVAGALTPAGYHLSCLIPLMEAGLVDWLVITGANLYHDMHYFFGHPMVQTGSSHWNDEELRAHRTIRIYDIVFPEEALLSADSFFKLLIRGRGKEFQRRMGTAEFHHLLGKYLISFLSPRLSITTKTLLGTAYQYDIPIYTSSPGDSSIGMNIAAESLRAESQGEPGLVIDSSIDVNETAALVYYMKKCGNKSAVVMLGGGSPKNFALQTEPQIQQIFNLDDAGHDYFIQITDARPDTGGLSGSTAGEALTWGKVNQDTLADAVTVYTDTTIALPLLTVSALQRPFTHSRLYAQRKSALQFLREHLI